LAEIDPTRGVDQEFIMKPTPVPAYDNGLAEGPPEGSPDDPVRYAVEAAVWAPSVHNTQPWWFGTAGSEPVSGAGWTADRRISLHADVERRLDVADPDGREMLISCGAALFTLRIAVRSLGHEPEVVVLSDADRPAHIADVRFGGRVTEAEEARRLYREIRRRRTHRGAFPPGPLPASLLSILRREAAHEGAELRIVADDRVKTALAALTEAAEHVQRGNPAYAAERDRWSPRPGSSRPDGVHESAYPRSPQHTDPHFAMRDYARGRGWGWGADLPEQPRRDVATGVVVLLATRGDDRADWLKAGQALQRILLRASAAEVSAAFHTQALEVPELRDFIRARFCDGVHPQMLFRLGLTVPTTPSASTRRQADEVVGGEL
jgi:hypothetical protein